MKKADKYGLIAIGLVIIGLISIFYIQDFPEDDLGVLIASIICGLSLMHAGRYVRMNEEETKKENDKM